MSVSAPSSSRLEWFTVGRAAIFIAALWLLLVLMVPSSDPSTPTDAGDVPYPDEPVGTPIAGRDAHGVAPRGTSVGDGSGADASAVSTGDVTAAPLTRDQLLLRSINPTPALSNGSLERCPSFRLRFGRDADGKSTHEAFVKYSRYVEQYCNTSGLLQMFVQLPTYLYFLDVIAKIAQIKNGSRIFDWGCGCGTLLNYYHTKYQTTGVGIDLVDNAIRHARAHSQPNQTFCHLDGTRLEGFPANSFDAIVSWAVLYHIRRTLIQCKVVHSLVRMLKPGGVAYIGHLRTEKTQDYWKKGNRCVPPGATLRRMKDFRTFHMPVFRKHQFFSLVLTKVKNDTADAGMGVTELPPEE